MHVHASVVPHSTRARYRTDGATGESLELSEQAPPATQGWEGYKAQGRRLILYTIYYTILYYTILYYTILALAI